MGIRSIDGRFFKDRFYLFFKSLALRSSGSTATSIRRVLDLSRNPILIGGCGRSGTTLALSVLSSHPSVFSIQEETGAFCPRPDSVRATSINPFRLRRIYYLLLKSEIPADCKRWCEKTPRNVHFIGELLDFLGPGLRFIHIVRDGRDVVTSEHPMEPNTYWVPKERWVSDVKAGLKFKDHPQVFTVRYEDLVAEYERTVRSLCSFLDEPVSPSLFDYPHTASVKESSAWFHGAKAVHGNSVERWRRPEHKAVLDAMMEDDEALSLLEDLGYLATKDPRP